MVNKMAKKKNTIVIAAVTCCGKTYFSQNSGKKKVLDTDSIEEFKSEKLYKNRVKLFINRIKDSLSQYDYILITATNQSLRELNTNGIPYVLVYPEDSQECVIEWYNRSVNRNEGWKLNSLMFRQLQDLCKHDKRAVQHIRLSKDQYLSDVISKIAVK